LKLNATFAAAMAAIAVCPIGAVAEVYSCEIKEWVRVNDEGLVRPAPSAPFKRHVSIDKETGNAVIAVRSRRGLFSALSGICQ
jgi:hypothetical protein